MLLLLIGLWGREGRAPISDNKKKKNKQYRILSKLRGKKMLPDVTLAPEDRQLFYTHKIMFTILSPI